MQGAQDRRSAMFEDRSLPCGNQTRMVPGLLTGRGKSEIRAGCGDCIEQSVSSREGASRGVIAVTDWSGRRLPSVLPRDCG